MADTNTAVPKVPKFAGIVIRSELSKTNYFFLFFNTFIIGMFMSIPAILQPAFMSDVINIDQSFSGSVNSFLQNMSQIATLAFVAIIGALSDKTGRRILILIGFILLAISFYLFKISNGIAVSLGISPDTAASICATLSFVPGKAAEFTSFAPGLLVAYVMRFMVGLGLILAYPQFITMVGDYTSDKDRGKGMAMNGMSMGFASILVFGAFGAIMKSGGVGAAFNATIVLASIGAILTGIFMKDRMPEKPAEKQGLKDVIPMVKSSKALKAAYMCALVTRADIIVLATYLVAWGVKFGVAEGMDSGKATLMATIPMMVMGVVSLFAFPVIGIMLDKKGRMPTLIISLMFAAAGMLLLGIAPTPFSPLCFVAAACAGIGMSGSIAGANTLAIDAAPITMMGSIMGGLNTMQPIGVLFFLGVGGYLFDSVSPGSAFVLKGAANIVLLIWIFMIKDAVTKEIQPTFNMDWEEDARQHMMKVPGGVRQGAIEGTEQYAESQDIKTITKDLCLELKKMMDEG
ncbi:MAG: MFS transporter [Deltaproteobacteria bacterium]|nr:MFS transporter [Deltaproteobacteria bacterium]